MTISHKVLIANSQVTFFEMSMPKIGVQALDAFSSRSQANPLQCHFVYANFRTITQNVVFC